MKKNWICLVCFICLLAAVLAGCQDQKDETEKLAKDVDAAYVGTYKLVSMGQTTGNAYKAYQKVPLSEDLTYGETITLHKNGLFDQNIYFYDDVEMKDPYQYVLQRYHYTNDGKNIVLNRSLKEDGTYYQIKAFKNDDGSLKMNYDGLKQLQDNGATLKDSSNTYELYDASKWYAKTKDTTMKEKFFFHEEGALVGVTYSKTDNSTSVLVYEKESKKK